MSDSYLWLAANVLSKLKQLFGASGSSGAPSPGAVVAGIYPAFKKSGVRFYMFDPKSLPESRAVLEDTENQVAYIHLLSAELGKQSGDYDRNSVFAKVLGALLRKRIAFTPENLPGLIAVVADVGPTWVPQGAFVQQLERYAEKNPLDSEADRALRRWRNIRGKGHQYASNDQQKITRTISHLLGEDVGVVFDESDDLGKAGSAALQKSAAAEKWRGLTELAAASSGGKPSEKNLKKANEIIAAIGKSAVVSQLTEWFGIVCKLEPRTFGYSTGLLHNHNAGIVKGLLWYSSLIDDDSLIRSVAAVTLKAFQKVPGVGPASALLGNAGIYALAHAPGFKGIPHLSRLKFRIRHNQAQKLVARYLKEVSEASGMTSDELEDITVPDFGLTAGELTEAFGECRAELKILTAAGVSIQWFSEAGKPVKSVPAKVKADYKEQYKDFQQTVKDIQQMLGGQRDRIDKFFIKGRTMSFADFKERFLDHGLMHALARNIIWEFAKDGKTAAGILLDGKLSNPDGKSLKWLDESTTVRLWHPIGKTIEEVVSWRHFIEENEIVQPFKQAHREVYIVTDAELRTDTYSNRFAAHLLRQHQMNALARSRGWSYSLMGAYDDGKEGDSVSLEIPEHGVRVEYWVNKIYENEQWNDAGILNYVGTDQVRFLHEGRLVPVASVNALLFSEAMRDIDLFVGVASVGNDPAWRDSAGVTANQRVYWERYAFGEVSESGKMRREILQTLIPRLKIKDKCELQDRFLRVQGSLRAYKIHLGSGNILMEPNDQYLCIVPGRGKTETSNVWLPFEGDGGLAIILSKAFLLADDAKITDVTITRQIKAK